MKLKSEVFFSGMGASVESKFSSRNSYIGLLRDPLAATRAHIRIDWMIPQFLREGRIIHKLSDFIAKDTFDSHNLHSFMSIDDDAGDISYRLIEV